MAFAVTLAFTFPLGPIVKLLLRSSILPSTWPSTYKSSDPDSSPLMTTDLPIRANSPVWGVSMQGLHLPRALVAANPLIVNHPLASSPGRSRDIILCQELTVMASTLAAVLLPSLDGVSVAGGWVDSLARHNHFCQTASDNFFLSRSGGTGAQSGAERNQGGE